MKTFDAQQIARDAALADAEFASIAFAKSAFQPVNGLELSRASISIS